MIIKLVSPKMSLRPMDSDYKRLMSPPVMLLALAALTPKEHTVKILDENTGPITDFSRCDLVGITCTIDTFYNACELARKFRINGSPVIMGGLFPSADPESALRHADSVCIGEAENVWNAVLNDTMHRALSKYYRADGPVASELIPAPDWEKIDPSRYLYSNIVITSRGCPHSCAFCYNSCTHVFKTFRRRPIENVIREIEHLNTKQVLFVDDNFIGNRDWVMRFTKAIKPLSLTWHAAVSVDVGNDPRLLDAMADSGCKSLFIGFETLSQPDMTAVRKHQNHVASYQATVRSIHDRAIMINASMVFGFDTDTKDVFLSTLSWLSENKIETMTAHILTPYPGTMLYARLCAENRITDYDLRHYNTSNVVFRPAMMSPDELQNGYIWIYREFYSFASIMKRLPDSRSQWMPYLLFNLGYRKFGKLTSFLGKIGLMSAIGRTARRLAYGIG